MYKLLKAETEDSVQRQLGEPLDLLAWGQRYLPDHFSRPASAMHRWLAAELDAMRQRRGYKLNVLGPRGSAKSTLGALAFPLLAAIAQFEPYIWLVSDTRHQACAHLENIKNELLDNPRLEETYPQAAGQGPVWRAGSIVLCNGVAIEAFGTGQRLRGRRYHQYRPTLIICDDVQNDGHMESARQRELSRRWFHGTLLKAGTPRTNVLSLATALHHDALAMELTRRPGWTSGVFRAIQRWPENMLLWQEWEDIYARADDPQAVDRARAFFEAHRDAMQAGAEVLWPEEEDLYTLMCMRVEGGRTTFEREKQNSPIDPEACEWPEAYFGAWLWFDEWPRTLAVKTIAIDPSKGADARRGDYSAIVLLGVDRLGIVYIEADLARRPTPQIVADAVEHCRRFTPDALGVESNQFQELLAGELSAACRRAGLATLAPVPIENTTNKLVRIRRLGPLLATRRLRFKGGSPGTRLLVEQLKQFPVADHDDGPDAAEMALRLAAQMLATRGRDDGLGSRLPVG